ncbi:MAG: hypothetical protein ACNS64_09230 [Candidatus Halalkalibacterium sp. M3_1C_030]
MSRSYSFTSFLRSTLAIFTGLLALGLIVFPSGIVIESVFPGSVNTNKIPITISSQILLIVIEFIGGSVATLVVSLMAPKPLNIHALLFGVLIFALNLSALFGSTAVWPLWLSIVLLTAIPIEVWTGVWLGKYIREGEQ